MNNLVYANFSINICILCCFTIIATSAIPPDYEYRKRLEEYYKSIGESFPQQTSNEIVATTEHPLQSSTPSQYHNYYYHENAKSREHNSEHNNKNEYDRYNNQKEYESSQSDSNQPDDISVDDLYQQRLKEHYQNIKKLQHLNQQNEVNEVDNNQGPEVKGNNDMCN
ncbi:hypothetical protein GJ496_005928 [Pomphorhynchus laevis]|nr:hypothetical protein GJ496_005928 [Pomphorhynchus laevis]